MDQTIHHQLRHPFGLKAARHQKDTLQGLRGYHSAMFHSASEARSIYPYCRIMQYAGLASLAVPVSPTVLTSDRNTCSGHQGGTRTHTVPYGPEVGNPKLCHPWQQTQVSQ